MPLFLMLLSLLLSACVTRQDYTSTLQSWHGQAANRLITQWGKPDETLARSNGKSILIYKSTAYQENPPSPPPAIGMNVSPSGTPVMVAPNPNAAWNQPSILLSCTTEVEVNPQGIITQISESGNGCGAHHSNQKF